MDRDLLFYVLGQATRSAKASCREHITVEDLEDALRDGERYLVRKAIAEERFHAENMRSVFGEHGQG